MRILVASFALVLVSACSWMPFRHGKDGKINDCNKPQGYEQAASNPPLKIPPGLDAMNTRGALRIPELREPEVPRKPGDACLDAPPKFSNAALLPPPRDKKAEKKLREQQKALEKEKKAHAREQKSATPPPAAPPDPAPAPPPAPATP